MSILPKSRSVYISVCSRQHAEWGAIIKLQEAMQVARSEGISTTLAPRVGESLICRARQNSLYDFYKRKFDYLFTVDDDVEVPIDVITKLVNADKDMIGGFYRLKDKSKALTAVRLLNGNIDFPEIFKKDLTLEVKYLSTGCMLVKRGVVKKMMKAYPELKYTANITNNKQYALYMPYIHNNEYLSEDWAFQQRAHEIGFKSWADGSIRCGHWGLVKYDFKDD